MTFAAVGSAFSATATTFTLTPHTVGDLILVEVISQTSADYATALSSSNVTWSVLVAHQVVGSIASTVFIGKVTSTSAATVTVTLNTGSPTLRIVGMEFSTTAGYANVNLDTSGTVNTTGGLFPSLTPGHGSGELYFGYAFNSGTATAGSTSGFSYFIDANGNGAAWNPACGTGAQQPAWTDTTDTISGVAVLLYEAGTPLPPAAAVTAAAYPLSPPVTIPTAQVTAKAFAPGPGGYPVIAGSWTGSFAIQPGYGFPKPSAYPLQIPVANTAGDWLFALVAWRPSPTAPDVSVCVADDEHNWWEPAGDPGGSPILDTTGAVILDTAGSPILDTTPQQPADSPAAGAVRVALWAAPAARVTPGGTTIVQVAPTGPYIALAALILDVSGMRPWYQLAAIAAGYANAATSLSLSTPAPAAWSLLFSLTGSDNNADTVTGPSGWTPLTTVTASNGVDHTADIKLTPAWQATSSGASSSVTSSGSLDLAGVIAGVLVAAPAPAQPNVNWPVTITEAAIGAGAQTPPSEITWTDISPRTLALTAKQGRQYTQSQLAAGQGTITLDNPDGALIPPGSGIYAGLDSGTPLRRRLIIPSLPSPHYVTYNGFFRRWPWQMDAGTLRGKTVAETADVWAYGAGTLNSMAIEECLVDSPHSLWPLTDATGASGGSNIAPGNSLPLLQVLSKYGAAGAVAQFGQNSGKLAGATSGKVTGSGVSGGGSGMWQQTLTGESFSVNGFGYALSCFDATYPAISAGVTAETWFGYNGTFTTLGAISSFAGTSGTFTTTASIPAGASVVFTAAAGFTFPSGITAGQVYYVLGNGGTSFMVSATYGGAAVTITVAGTAYIQVQITWDPVVMALRDTQPVSIVEIDVRNTDGALLLAQRTGPSTRAVAVIDSSRDYRIPSVTHVSLGITQTTWQVLVNAGSFAAVTGTFSPALPAGFREFSAGGIQDVSSSGGALPGVLGFAAVYPGVSPQARVVSRYWATGAGMVNEAADARIERILEYAGLAGRRWLGQQNVLYEGDLCASGKDVGGQAAVSSAGNIAQSTLPAMLYVAPTGDIVYRSKLYMWNEPVKWVLGDNVAGGEIPFLIGQFGTDYDPTRVVEDIQLTQPDSQSVTVPAGIMAASTMKAVTAATAKQYGGQPYQQTSYLDYDWSSAYTAGGSLQDLANWIANSYSKPANRVQAVTVEASANAANLSSQQAWQFVAGASPGDMVKVNVRPPTMTGTVSVIARITQTDRSSQFSQGGTSAKITCTLDFAAEYQALICDDPVRGALNGSNCLPWLPGITKTGHAVSRCARRRVPHGETTCPTSAPQCPHRRSGRQAGPCTAEAAPEGSRSARGQSASARRSRRGRSRRARRSRCCRSHLRCRR